MVIKKTRVPYNTRRPHSPPVHISNSHCYKGAFELLRVSTDLEPRHQRPLRYRHIKCKWLRSPPGVACRFLFVRSQSRRGV
jgi:hypothetical protein